MGNCVNCKSIDNRVSVFILIEMLRELKDVPYDVYSVFTVQEEVGIRGANVATQEVQSDLVLVLTPLLLMMCLELHHTKITELEKAAIKVMDSSTICDYRMVSYMKEVAKKHKILHQLEILTGEEQIQLDSAFTWGLNSWCSINSN